MNTTQQLQARLDTPIQFLTGGYPYRPNVKRVHCADGVHLSVQASEGHYCTPRDNAGPYTKVEVGFPSIIPSEAMMVYCENTEDPTGTVYPYVPIELVVAFIDAHGGIVDDERR